MKVNVVGGGLAGLAAAVRLAAEGHQVAIFEQNGHLGGKMNVWKSMGYTFDMGPTIITMPDVLNRLFESVGRRMEDYVDLVSLDPQWRTFYADGSHIDLCSSLEAMTKELSRTAPSEIGSYLSFLTYCQRMYDISEKWFFWKPWGSLKDVMSASTFGPQSLSLAAAIDPMSSIHQAVGRHFKDPRLKQLFEHFVQYVGSSPFVAPAILCLIPWVQLGYGCWYPMGGTGQIAAALTKLCDEFNIEVHCNTTVSRIEITNGKAAGIVDGTGKIYPCDAIVANSDITKTCTELLPEKEAAAAVRRQGSALEPACSGMVLYLGCRKKFSGFLHHDFLFSADSDAEFADIYEKKIPHGDPSIYLAIPSLTDPTVAPEGCEAVYALVHTPYISPEYDWSTRAKEYRDIIVKKMERCGFDGLEESIETERWITPLDLEKLYRVNKGAIYGVVTRRGITSAFKTGNRSALPGLYFAGGSVNPGAGVPMVLMSGQIAAECLLEDVASAGAAPARKAASA
jgi:diapolycopene oxygenase